MRNLASYSCLTLLVAGAVIFFAFFSVDKLYECCLIFSVTLGFAGVIAAILSLKKIEN